MSNPFDDSTSEDMEMFESDAEKEEEVGLNRATIATANDRRNFPLPAVVYPSDTIKTFCQFKVLYYN